MGLLSMKTVGEYLDGIGRALVPIKKSVRKIRKKSHRPLSERAFFQAADISRLTYSWKRQTASADAEIFNELSTIRSRSRDLSRNNDYAARFLNMCKTNVVGAHGIQMQAKPTVGKAAKRQIDEAFKAWKKRGICTVCGTMSFTDCEKLIIETIARDGEILIRTVRGWDNPFGFAIQIIEPEYLDESYNVNLPNGNQVRMGVEIDPWRRPVAYHILAKHPGDMLYATTQLNQVATRIRIPADEIIHPFIRHRANQSRGYPWFVTPAYRLNMLGGYEEAELVASRVAAAKMGFFKSPDGAGYTGDDSTDEEGHEPIMEAEPGTFEQLPQNMDFVAWNPEHPTSAYEAFVLATLRGISSGLNVSYVSLANDLRGVSYSSIRYGTLEERDHWLALQAWLVENFHQIVFERWLEMAIVSYLDLPYVKLEKFKAVNWRPRGWQWVDPQKEIAASVSAIQNGLTSPQRVVAAQGLELSEVLQEIAEAQQMAEDAGVNISLFGAPEPEPPPDLGQNQDMAAAEDEEAQQNDSTQGA